MSRRLPGAVPALVACLALCAAPIPASAQSEIPVPPPPGPLPHERVHALIGAVQSLVAPHILTSGQAHALVRGLDKAGEALRRGEAQAAVGRLETFSRHVSGLAAAGTLSSPTAQRLLEEASRARGQIAEMAFGAGAARPASWSFEGCVERRPCRYAVVFVNPRAAVLGARDGSETRPYRTIADALRHAEERGACGVDIRLADGLYWEDVVVSRHTTIDGQSRRGTVLIGAIVNNAGVDLAVRDLSVAAVRGPGGVFADAPCAGTRLTNVLIDSSARFGVYQRGGVLTVSSSVIRNTAADENSRFAGTAVFLTGGVQAVLGLVEIADNASGGLVASGSQTRVYATSVSVTGTGVNPSFRGEASWLDEVPAAVEVRDGALLLMEFSTVIRSELAGLRVRDGSRAHFRYGLVERTREVPEHEHLATANAIAISDGTILELSNFTLTRGAIAGLMINGAFATASDGEVSLHPIGAVIQGMPAVGDPDYGIESAVACLDDDVDFSQNDRPLDAEAIPVPCLGPDCPVPVCRRVAFVCPWCDLGP